MRGRLLPARAHHLPALPACLPPPLSHAPPLQHSEPDWAPTTRPPPEVLLLPADATVGQLLEAATAAYRASYRMCAAFNATSVVGGLSLDVPPPPPELAAAAADAQQQQQQAAGMEVDPASPEAVAAATAAAAVAAAVGQADAMDVDPPATAVAAAAAGPGAEAAPAPAPAAEPEGGADAERRSQAAQQRQALLATRLADVLLPPPAPPAAGAAADAAPRDGAGGSAQAARAEAAEACQLPAVTVAGSGYDWAVRWRHAGATLRCAAGAAALLPWHLLLLCRRCCS